MWTDSGLLGWIVAVTPLVGMVWYLVGTPGAVVLAAVVPALGYAGLLARIARVACVRLRRPVVLFAVVWGAGVAALAAAPVNDLLQTRFGTGGWLLAVIGVPLVEEGAKAGVLLALVLIWRTELHGVRAGIVIGGLVGWGFSLAENLQYLMLAAVQEGPAGLVRATWVRGFLEGAVHPLFTASTAAGLGIARAAPGGPTPVRASLVGFGAAVVQHALWNGIASRVVTEILCNGVAPGGACRGDPDVLRLLVAVPLVVAAALGPGVVTLTVLARRPA